MTPQQREYCKAKAGQPFVLDYILGNNHPTVKWFKRQIGEQAIPDDMIAKTLLERDELQQAAIRKMMHDKRAGDDIW